MLVAPCWLLVDSELARARSISEKGGTVVVFGTVSVGFGVASNGGLGVFFGVFLFFGVLFITGGLVALGVDFVKTNPSS